MGWVMIDRPQVDRYVFSGPHDHFVTNLNFF
jgi:hypothetical protein